VAETVKNYKHLNAEVLYTQDAVTIADYSDIDHFKQLSTLNKRKRVRLCTHLEQTNLIHEMIIVHEKGAYVRPHKHLGKSESTHIIEGSVDIVLFEDDGRIAQVIEMGEYASEKPFFYRMAMPTYHTLIIRSEVLVFHETTNGPFNKDATIFALWAPEDADVNSVEIFMGDLLERVSLIL